MILHVDDFSREVWLQILSARETNRLVTGSPPMFIKKKKKQTVMSHSIPVS